MEIKRHNIPDGVEQVFAKKRHKHHLQTFFTRQPRVFHGAILLSLITLLIIYIMMPISRIQIVEVRGNTLYSNQEIMDIANIHQGGLYYQILPFYYSFKLRQDPYIEQAKIHLQQDNQIMIEIVEKHIVGYQYEENPMFIFQDGKQKQIESSTMQWISKIPLIHGFLEEDIRNQLAQALANIDPEVLSAISEITQYALDYDSYGIVIMMRNGGTFIGNFHNLRTLNQYFEIYSHLNDPSQCIFGTDKQDYAYASVCPWHQPQQDLSMYWLNEDGTIKTNSFGFPLMKHYYYDETGKQAVDQTGQPIVIPLDEHGYELYDHDFHQHYADGLYASGVYQGE